MNEALIPSSTIVLISANAEWRAIRKLFPDAAIQTSPYGEWFEIALNPSSTPALTGFQYPFTFFHGGWGKIAAAASTQYVIDRWHPDLLVNLGTCGGFEGQVERGTILLVDKTIVYDIIEQMGDFDSHIAHYTTEIDLSWLGEEYPIPVRRSLIVSGDRDLLIGDIPMLKSRYGAIAGDWESGAIAWVARHNGVRVLILRGVTDLVNNAGGEAYGNLQLYHEAAYRILSQLVETLPEWLGVLKHPG